jgi:hypothetical protein
MAAGVPQVPFCATVRRCGLRERERQISSLSALFLDPCGDRQERLQTTGLFKLSSDNSD